MPLLSLRRAVAFALPLLTLAGGALCAQEYSFRNLGTEEGLNNLAILRIYEDRASFLWMSTEDGIFRYVRFNLVLQFTQSWRYVGS